MDQKEYLDMTPERRAAHDFANAAAPASQDENFMELVSQGAIRSWQPIETAPKNKVILIREKNYQPDLVQWQYERHGRMINGNWCFAIPEGWFQPYGSRSRVQNPTEWFDIPA